MRLRNVVIVSPFFPPSTLAGVHRARHLAKHLPAAGWNPIVLCVDEAYHAETLDPQLAALVPAATEIVRAPAVPVAVARPFGLGDIGLRGWWGLARALARLLRTRDVAAVLMTGSPYYPMLMAPWIGRRFAIPVVLDFQDPWGSDWGRALAGWNKARLSHALAERLEPRAARGADFVVSVSARQNEDMLARHPWLDRARMAAIPIGGDPDDFVALRAASGASPWIDPAKINLSYVGALLPRAEPAVRAVLRAVARLRARRPDVARRLRLNFVGGSNQPDGAGPRRASAIAAAEGVADLVAEEPARVPYLEALRILAQSDGLLLIGSDEPHYTASKIYPALMSGRPYVSLFHEASSAHAILSAAGGGAALSFSCASECAALDEELVDALRRLAGGAPAFERADPAAYRAYEASAIARRFAEIFDTLATAPARGVARASRPA